MVLAKTQNLSIPKIVTQVFSKQSVRNEDNMKNANTENSNVVDNAANKRDNTTGPVTGSVTIRINEEKEKEKEKENEKGDLAPGPTSRSEVRFDTGAKSNCDIRRNSSKNEFEFHRGDTYNERLDLSFADGKLKYELARLQGFSKDRR
jgi:hypothetical protein